MTAPKTERVFITHVEDKPGVLNRVISLFRRRGYNIDSLQVARTERPDVSRLTLVMQADEDTAKLLVANLYKQVNVLHVEEVGHQSPIQRELVLVKVRPAAAQRDELTRVCQRHAARPINEHADCLVYELSGHHQEVDAFVESLRPFGLVEMARTGVMAMLRDGTAPASRWESAA